MKHTEPKTFSGQLKNWVKGKQPKTLDTLIDTFGEKSFAVIMLLFMLLPALPIPTAAHPLEAVVIIVAAEQVIGLKAIWLPKFISKKINLERLLKGKTIDSLLKRVEWLESKSSPRGKWIFSAPLAPQILGLIIIGFTLAAFFAPPFSALDTLPAIGVVLMSLALLLDDAIMLTIGIIIGAIGVVLSVFFGAVVVHFIKQLFHKK